MQRVRTQPRPNWQTTVESQGMHFHTIDGMPYWDESIYYLFTAAEIDAVEKATYELDRMCLEAVEHVIQNRLFSSFSIPDAFIDYVTDSWQRDEHTIYGRYDFAYDGRSPPKLLEFNADTPTALLEASVIQWYWIKDLAQDTAAGLDQFNSIHERLIEAWRAYQPEVTGVMYFTALAGNVEDYMTANYLRDTAIQAGLRTAYLHVRDIAWNARMSCFVCNEAPMHNVFKLYPWEWMLREPFGRFLPVAHTRWLEAPWKTLLSNKAILPILYQLHPDSPYLLRTELEPFGDTYVKKPTLGREGACITVVQEGRLTLETDGFEFYRTCPSVYQEYRPLPEFDSHYPVVGSWLVNSYACGMGIREDDGPITQNTSRFVPHVFAT
jgi:glutathionylspermidine synthase